MPGMNTYELTVVLSEKTTPAKKKAFEENLEKTLKELKGAIKKSSDWGKIDFAYTISGNSAGMYLHYDLELEGAAVKNLDDKLRMQDGTLRHLLIRKDK